MALPRGQRTTPRVLTVEEARLFLKVAASNRYGVAFVLALTTGMRPSELLALRWADVNWQEQTMTVERTLEKGRGWKFSATKRPASRRKVQLHSWVVRMLGDLRRAREFDRYIDTAAGQQIFSTADGQPLNSDHLGRELKGVLAGAGLPRIRLYDLRHTAASLALAAGASPKAISEQLGHASTAFTLDVYAHLLPHMQAEAAQRVENLLGITSGAKRPPVSIRPQAVAAITA